MASTFLSKHIVESLPEDWPSNRETALTGTIDSSVSQVVLLSAARTAVRDKFQHALPLAARGDISTGD